MKQCAATSLGTMTVTLPLGKAAPSLRRVNSTPISPLPTGQRTPVPDCFLFPKGNNCVAPSTTDFLSRGTPMRMLYELHRNLCVLMSLSPSIALREMLRIALRIRERILIPQEFTMTLYQEQLSRQSRGVTVHPLNDILKVLAPGETSAQDDYQFNRLLNMRVSSQVLLTCA
ncbi:unnamed protein product [Peronospora belbahrii]|uniref:Uncharacterized protein n=1 Tax=Peronospora belbahrii TaxID=622444 RepID=A0AAU9L6G3_9STRA|nr:unnamed protein product [Peronospora belbahrii]